MNLKGVSKDSSVIPSQKEIQNLKWCGKERRRTTDVVNKHENGHELLLHTGAKQTYDYFGHFDRLMLK